MSSTEIPLGYRLLVVDPDGTDAGSIQLGDNLDEGLGGGVVLEEIADRIERHERALAARGAGSTRRGARRR